MNLAEIRKKAQQAQKQDEGKENLPVPAPPRAEVPPLPPPLGLSGLDELSAPAAPVFPDQLGVGTWPEPGAFPSEAAGSASPAPDFPDPMELSVEPLLAQFPASPEPEAALKRQGNGSHAAASPAAETPPVTTFPAIVAAPAPPGPLPPEELFDPLAVILRGRELAEAEEREAHVVVEEVASIELLCFRVADETYAIDILDIKEIMRPREVTEVPRVPSFVRGILSLRGVIIPVFDMRLRLGLTGGAPGERERVIVVKRDGGFCGVLVDEVVQVVRVPVQGIEPPPVVLEGIDREFVGGIGRVHGRMLILLDMAKVLDVTLG